MIILFPNTSRMYFYRQGERSNYSHTDRWFKFWGLIPKWLPRPLRHHSFMTSSSGEQTRGCLDDPLSPVWKCSLLQFFSASQLLKGLKSLPSQCPASQCAPLSTVTWSWMSWAGWAWCSLIKSHFMTKKLSLNMLGSPFGQHLGLSCWIPEHGQVRITLLASIQGQGEVWLLSGPADVPKRARESVFWATASPQNGVACFKDEGSNGMRTRTLSWHIVFA